MLGFILYFFLLSTTERTHTAPWIYSIWYPLGCLILILCLLSCAMNILQGHKRKLLYVFGGGNTGPDGEGGGADKSGWGRPRYYQTVLFISSFCKIRESRTQFYYFFPRLAAVTVVTSRHQTAGSSMYRTYLRLPRDGGIILDHMSVWRCTRYLCKHFIYAPTCRFQKTSRAQRKTHYVKMDFSTSLPTAAH